MESDKSTLLGDVGKSLFPWLQFLSKPNIYRVTAKQDYGLITVTLAQSQSISCCKKNRMLLLLI